MAPIPTKQTSGTNGSSPGTRALPIGVHLSMLLALSVMVTACSTLGSISDTLFGRPSGPQLGQPGFVKGFIGEVVADEPRAATAGKEVLSGGGDAADAAVAVGLSLAVTLPSRAGLGGGGACIAYTQDHKAPARGIPEAILFESPAVRSAGGGDRPAAVPMLARGLFLMHARHGRQPFESLIIKAEQLARFGVPASRALTRDLSLVAGPLFGDPTARAVFGPGGTPLTEGQGLIQPDLAATLAQLRVTGVGDLYLGILARRLALASPAAGVPIGLADLRAGLPSIATPVTVNFGEDRVVFPPTAGGLAAAAGFMSLKSQPADGQAALMRGLAAAARWRLGGANSDEVLNGDLSSPVAVPLYPATTTFATLDPDGNAVVCALTMNNLFGTGRIIPGLGFLAAASPATVTPPLLAVGLALSQFNSKFHVEAGGSGQSGAGVAAAIALMNMLRSGQPMPNLVPDPGRANVISCSGYAPGSDASCAAIADPRESGLALGGGS